MVYCFPFRFAHEIYWDIKTSTKFVLQKWSNARVEYTAINYLTHLLVRPKISKNAQIIDLEWLPYGQYNHPASLVECCMCIFKNVHETSCTIYHWHSILKHFESHMNVTIDSQVCFYKWFVAPFKSRNS